MNRLLWNACYFLDMLNESNLQNPCIEKATAILKCEAITDLLEKDDKRTIAKIREDFNRESQKEIGASLGIGAGA